MVIFDEKLELRKYGYEVAATFKTIVKIILLEPRQ